MVDINSILSFLLGYREKYAKPSNKVKQVGKDYNLHTCSSTKEAIAMHNSLVNTRQARRFRLRHPNYS